MFGNKLCSRPNYYLPPLIELEPEAEAELEDVRDSKHGSPAGPASFDENYRLCPDPPLPRRLRSSR